MTRFIIILLAIEFLDEFVFGAREAAWPLIRDELTLSYGQVGLLLSLVFSGVALAQPDDGKGVARPRETYELLVTVALFHRPQKHTAVAQLR